MAHLVVHELLVELLVELLKIQERSNEKGGQIIKQRCSSSVRVRARLLPPGRAAAVAGRMRPGGVRALEDDLEEDSSKSRSSKAKPPSHRNIPAWEDAMAFIVDGNLQTRTERRPASSRAGDRGRPRGRRKKKKS